MIDIATLTLLDYGVLIILVVSCIIAFMRGMMREFLGLTGWVVSFFAANYAAPRLETTINDTLNLGGFGEALAWGVPFAVSVVAWFIIASMIAPGLARGIFGGFDRWLGMMFGILRGGLVVLILFVASVLAVDGEDNLPEYMKSSRSLPLMSYGAYHLAGFLPEQFSDQIIDNLEYRPTFGQGPVSDKINHSIEAGQKAVDNGMKLLKDEKTE
jgi:membrane protein required for colicin V production